MLVINGVDAQTNSHTVGIVHNWSGRNSEGYPAMSALLAARYGPELPVAYLSFGGYSDTGGVTRYTRAEQRGPAAQHRAASGEQRGPGTALHERGGLGGGTCPAGAGCGTAGVGAEPAARRCCATGCCTSRHSRRRKGLTAYADAIPPEEELEQGEEYETSSGNEFHSQLRRQTQLGGAGVQDGRGGECGSVAGRVRYARDARPGPGAGCWAT